jgi:hypothetical protein
MTDAVKALMVQSCINPYDGVHGGVDWSFVDMRTLKKHYDESHIEWYTCMANLPEVGTVCLIVFRGSDEKEDWKTNFDAKKINSRNNELIIPYGNTQSKIRMHRGFVEAYSTVQEKVRRVARTAWKAGIPCGVIGHSLGAAEATVCTIDLHFYAQEVLEMFDAEIRALLFGYAAASPAVGNQAFVDSFNFRMNGRFFNEWYGWDTVHSAPTWWMGYRHVGKEKQWISFADALLTPISTITAWGTLGALPTLAVWDHDPRRLLAAIRGERIPAAKLDARK